MEKIKLNNLTPEEIEDLDRQLKELEPKLHEAGRIYDEICEQYKQLLYKRYPERQEEYMKQILYDAYKKSPRTIEQILAYMAGTDPEDIW